MKSDVIHVSTLGQGLGEALKEADRVAAYKELPVRDSMQLRLLAEEMTGMLRGVANVLEGDFWIEDRDGVFSLHLVSETAVNAQMREDLLKVSSSGKNAAAKGVIGRIRDLFVRAFEPQDELSMDVDAYMGGWLEEDTSSMIADAMSGRMWSLNRYRQALADRGEKQSEAWDELEKSIVANVADEIVVAIRDGQVEMVITKRFAR